MVTTRFERYNQKCKFFSIRLRQDKDKKYIKFLDSCPNRVDFIRKAIDKELAE